MLAAAAIGIHSPKPSKTRQKLRQKMFSRFHRGGNDFEKVQKQNGKFDKLTWILKKHYGTHAQLMKYLKENNNEEMFYHYFRMYFKKLVKN